MTKKLDKLKIALNKYKKAAREPFKEDIEVEAATTPANAPATVDATKQAMPRAPFKSQYESLAEAVQNGLEATVDYIESVEGQKGHDHRSQAEEQLETLDSGTKALYVAMLPRLYAKFGQTPGNLPYLLAASLLEDFDIKVPTSAILRMPLDAIVDEYFGTVYQPGRLVHRFEASFKDRVLDHIKSELTVGDFLTKSSDYYDSARSLINVDDLIDIWGLSEVKNWWRTADEKDLRTLRDHAMTDEPYESLVERFGGGLID
jgi:hypothetical protein